MLTASDLLALQRELADSKVLSVYLDTSATDPAMRDAWRPALHTALRDARSRIEDDNERADFDRAAEFLKNPEPSPGGTWRAHGWVAFASPNGARYVGDLPVTTGTQATWRTGPVIAPYMRALKQLRPVLVALVESGSARIFRYAIGKLESVGELEAPGTDTERAGRPTAPSVRGGAAAPRGATGSDAANHRRRAAFDRLVVLLGQRIQQLDHDHSWILIGGTREWATRGGDALARQFAGRILTSTTLAHDATETEIAAAAKHAASDLRAALGVTLVDQLVEQGGANARSAVGVPATQRALREHSVDLLLVTPRFIGAHEQQAEDFVRATIASGADVEIPSGEAAEHLDRAADGVAARLRFSTDGAPSSTGARV